MTVCERPGDGLGLEYARLYAKTAMPMTKEKMIAA
jgi:hypothetical protein